MFKRYEMTVDYCNQHQKIKGWLAHSPEAQADIFLCQGDSLDSKRPWYAFNAFTGKVIRDHRDPNRADCFFFAEMNLLANRPHEELESIPF